MSNAKDIAIKFTGEFPDVHGRKLAKTWDILRDMLKDEIETYARECCQATLEKAAGNAKTKKYGNSGSWFDASVDKSSITNKDNICIL